MLAIQVTTTIEVVVSDADSADTLTPYQNTYYITIRTGSEAEDDDVDSALGEPLASDTTSLSPDLLDHFEHGSM